MRDLEDEEAIVVQVNPLALQQVCHLGEVALARADVVVGRVVAVGRPGHGELRSWDHVERLVPLQGQYISHLLTAAGTDGHAGQVVSRESRIEQDAGSCMSL